MNTPDPTWHATLPAARAVARHATDTGEARELLDMLGLVDDTGRIRPDDTRQYDIEGAQPVKTTPKGAQLWEPPARPETLTSPPGLRVLPPVPAEPRKPVARSAPRTRTKSRVQKSRAVPADQHKPRRQAECGTVSGCRRHTRAGEPICDACREARNAYDRQRWRTYRAKPKTRKTPTCGTLGGYSGHRRRGEDACEGCKVAMRAYFRARYAAKTSGMAEFERLRAAGVNEASAAILARVENVGEVAS